ncbi:MAG: AAA-like domain-containing protein [Cyanobacteria bacterium SID2]|nr:AAA-like domain-containing protein [Cyanobacteria bacterium SID2]MBP0003173.1 AAA-like domain-containing protein [Cyanobacteria bacterium SBC]
MTADEALALLDTLLPDCTFNNLQETVFCQVWEGKTYAEIARENDYEHSYIRDVGFKLWQILSEAFDKKVTKSNLQSVFKQYTRTQASPTSDSISASSAAFAPNSVSISKSIDPSEFCPTIEFPSGPVPLKSRFYIEREPVETCACSQVVKPGSFTYIEAPRQLGKTSLLWRMLAHARSLGFQVVTLSLHRAESQVFSSLDRFLRWFCANVSRQLKVSIEIDRYWNEDLGSKISCTAYFEEHLLPTLKIPLVIAFDEFNRLFEYPDISREFLPLLRSWYEEGKELEPWQNLRWIVVSATDVYVPFELSASPFEVGLAVKLPKFTLTQVCDLAQRYGLVWVKTPKGKDRIEQLIQMTGGCPKLMRLAFYHISRYHVDPEQLLEEAPTQTGIYSDILRHYLAALRPHPELETAFKQVVNATESVELDPIVAYRLQSLGTIKLERNRAKPICDLLRLYFKSN